MIEIRCEPPISARLPIDSPFVQTITLVDDGRILGIARWHSPADASVGLAQVLDLTVPAPHQRRGNGKRLLDAVIEQARELHRRRSSKLRRVWMPVEQKSQVIGRAFLTGRGFHHIGTASGLYRDQDLMVFVKSMD